MKCVMCACVSLVFRIRPLSDEQHSGFFSTFGERERERDKLEARRAQWRRELGTAVLCNQTNLCDDYIASLRDSLSKNVNSVIYTLLRFTKEDIAIDVHR